MYTLRFDLHFFKIYILHVLNINIHHTKTPTFCKNIIHFSQVGFWKDISFSPDFQDPNNVWLNGFVSDEQQK